MFQNRAEYDRGVNTFSPEGRLFQVEYAVEAIKLGSTAIGIKCDEGVVLAIEKRIASSLLEPSSVEKIFEIDTHIGCAVSGLTADAKMLVEHARVETQQHTFVYNEPMRVESVAQGICNLSLRFGENDDSEKSILVPLSRPFGVALLIAGMDATGPHLFFADPSGTYSEYYAKAMGAGAEMAQTQLQEAYKKTLSLQDSENLAIKILKEAMEEAINSTNAQIASITKQGFRIYSEVEIQQILSRQQ